VTTKSGETGTVEDIRVFPYPIAFDPPQLVTPVQTNATNATLVIQNNPPTVIPSTPTDFKRRNIGVRLVVKPQIAADNKTIDLSLFPEVTDFEGFINYGSPIEVVNPQTREGIFGILGFASAGTPTGLDPTSLLSSNDVNQPVFNTRRIQTKVLIQDGSTVVLGGLMRDDVETVNDKVPILADLPLIGRLFQSKAIEDTKKNLLIFVTATIYQNDGELRNPPEVVDAADVLTGHATASPVATP
jgi:general secretion pathway protein D